MRPSRDLKYLQPSAYSRRSSSYVDRDFQLKYTRSILTMAIVSTALFLFPAFYFSNQNYSLFFDLADLLNPSLANYIAKERIAFNVIFAAAVVANVVFWIIFSKKMTAKIAGPAKILRNHIRLVSRGDYALSQVRVREDDEFKELINSYNYLYALLKIQNKKELDDLNKIKSTIKNPIALELINGMIDERLTRLNVSTPAASHDSLHVS